MFTEISKDREQQRAFFNEDWFAEEEFEDEDYGWELI